MIPRHSLPFGTRELFSILVASAPSTHPSDLERAYADEFGMREAVLVPSVRAGIDMLIRACDGKDRTVAGPAYTCGTVHEAMARSGVRMRLLDCAPGSFLMSPEAIAAAANPECALVLSEVYGIPYDLEMIDKFSGQNSCLRIMDLAMSIPSPQRLTMLQERDAALFSFGWGKPMYAGWGGIVFLQDPELAGRVREILARRSTPEIPALQLRRAGAVILSTVMNQRPLYGISHERHIYRLLRNASSSRVDRVCLPETSGGSLPPQWTRPMTSLNRRLALHNLRSSMQNAALRREQAGIYHMSLVETGIVPGPGSEVLPQSHFPIRVLSAIRDTLCDYLRGRGIDTGTLFPLPRGLSRDDYPHAAEAAAEVITLPLGPALTTDEVRAVSKSVEEGLQKLGKKRNSIQEDRV